MLVFVGPTTETRRTLAEGCLAELANLLEVDVSGEPIVVRVGAPASGAVGREIFVEARSGGALEDDGWFELLVRHELVHLLLALGWGRAPALFWEGLPIALGDAHVRRTRLGISYAAHCGALRVAGRLLPLAGLLLASQYYPRRTDPRVDLQAGAFCGWLLDRGSLPEVRRLFEVWRPPTPDHPILDLGALTDALGEDLPALEQRWHGSLAGEADPALVIRYRDAGDRPLGVSHCDFCFAPREADPCEQCGARVRPVSVVG